MTPAATLSRPRARSLLAGAPVALALVALALAAAACGGAAAPASTPGSPPASASPSLDPGGSLPPTVAEPTPVPGATGATGDPTDDPTGDPGGDPGSGPGGGSEPGNPGGDVPLPVEPGAGGAPDNPEPTIVTPTAGLTGIHAVPAVKLEAAVNGRDVAVRIAWWSGVEPCNALAGVTVARDGDTFLLTVNEGSAAGPDTMCIEIARYKAFVVDLGELEPGTYTITALGDAPPVEVTVAG